MTEKMKCKHFCSKSVPDEICAKAFSLSEGHVWCIHTMGAVGPDEDVVDGSMCTPERECFQPDTIEV